MIITTLFMIIVMLGVVVYIFAIYCDPEDLKLGNALFAKIIIVAGYFLCCAFILTMTLDIANSRGEGGGLNIELLY